MQWYRLCAFVPLTRVLLVGSSLPRVPGAAHEPGLRAHGRGRRAGRARGRDPCRPRGEPRVLEDPDAGHRP
jgi:hypothetical protein